MKLDGSGGVTLDVRVRAGSGRPAFLLVHGLASNARMWDGVADRLEVLGHPVGAVDQRGHGRSDKPDTGYDFETLTEDLVAVLDGLGWNRAIVAGQSWGGNVALELGCRHPERLAGIACVDGGTIDLSARFPSWEACREALTPPATTGRPAAEIEAFLRTAHPDWPESGIQGALACFEVRPDGTVAPWLSLDRHLLILRHLWEHRPSSRYPLVKVPVLLAPADTPGDPSGSAADKAASVAAAEAALPVARVRWFSPSDHDLHAQHPVELADVLAGAVREGFFA